MKKIILLTAIAFITQSNIYAKDISFTFTNKTEQMITTLEYWLGSATESNSPNLSYSSKGSLAIDGSIEIPMNFHKTKRNTVMVRAYLKGGGYISQKYTINKGQKTPSLALLNITEKVSTDEFNKVKSKFTELKLDKGYLKTSKENGIDALIGSIIIYDVSDKVIYKIDPKILKTKVSSTSLPDLKQTIEGIFSSETAISGSVNLPFVNISSSFSTGDVAKFIWEIEDVGQYTWSSENGKSLAELFLALPQETKDDLVQLYTDNPKAQMKFIDEAFMIGRLEVTTKKSRKISSTTELNAANYVTGKGNYLFIDDLTDTFVVRDVITEVDGYNATNMLKTLYLKEKAKLQNSMVAQDEDRIKEEYKFLLKLYPQYLEKTDNVEIMKKAIRDLSKDKEAQLLFINKTLDKEKIKLNDIELENIEKQ
ncbi:hypothetical protein G3O08_19840 [Cryomorpha ignava]|uniref:Uncharacterized protein n=1 Tax=Cryomorpha ignava TaxID=101383 RepID=A0A7K3WW50_9FLAO|nr:hypothetical protein [Cryomorpha ignava]NEN25746.1 hypothetical protein [Cryomorpha ignava]